MFTILTWPVYGFNHIRIPDLSWNSFNHIRISHYGFQHFYGFNLCSPLPARSYKTMDYFFLKKCEKCEPKKQPEKKQIKKQKNKKAKKYKAIRTSAEHSGHQDTDFIQVKCSKPCLLQKSSPPVRGFKIKNRAPSLMTLACIASNKAAPPLHPQLPQLITSQRTLFSHLRTRPPQALQAAKK